MTIRRKYIQRLADQLLLKHRISSPPVDVGLIADGLGIRVSKQSVDDNVSGFLLTGPNQKSPVIGVNANQSDNRQRFTIAHELGHFLLHKGETVHVDSALKFEIRLRDAESSKGLDLAEREANAFAAEILMPQTFLERDILAMSKLDTEALDKLAQHYQVSRDAFTFRLANLGYVTL
jgi:Zn-dependent peptidase ImmA (M78 family)